jgi:hypothetical protein
LGPQATPVSAQPDVLLLIVLLDLLVILEVPPEPVHFLLEAGPSRESNQRPPRVRAGGSIGELAEVVVVRKPTALGVRRSTALGFLRQRV